MENAIGSAVSFVADKVIGAVATEVNEKVIVPKKEVDCKSNFQFARFTSGYGKVLQD